MPSIPLEIPAVIRQRLAAERIFSLADWRQAGRRRLRIFGITRAMVAQLDALARRQP